MALTNRDFSDEDHDACGFVSKNFVFKQAPEKEEPADWWKKISLPPDSESCRDETVWERRSRLFSGN